MMKYFLHGGGREVASLLSSQMQEWFEALAIGRLLCIPLAIKEDSWHHYWLEKSIGMSKVEVKALTLHNLPDAEELFSWADAVYFPGGSQKTLLTRMVKYKLDDLLQENIGHFKALGGGSAGLMALGQKTIVGKNKIAYLVEGLNIFENTIFDSHFSNRFREWRLEIVTKELAGYTGIGIDENTMAIFDEHQKLRLVFGEGGVHLYKNGKVLKR